MLYTNRILLICLLLFFIPLSDCLPAKETWEDCKENTMALLPSIPGWCSKEKALAMMEIIKKNNCQKCVEIGVFAGRSGCLE